MVSQPTARIIHFENRCSKAGLNAMSQSMAQALAPYGVFFYVVAPGFVETDMASPLLRGPEGDAIRSQSPLGRVATPEEVARTVGFWPRRLRIS